MKVRTALPMIVVGWLIASCGAPPPGELNAQDEAAIRGIFDKVVNSARANDWATWASVYADHVEYHAPGVPPVNGRQAVQQWAEGLTRIEAIDFQDIRVRGSGNMAYGTGGYTMTLQGSPPDRGKQIAVFERDETGTWRVVAVSFNSNQSVPSSGEATPTLKN